MKQEHKVMQDDKKKRRLLHMMKREDVGLCKDDPAERLDAGGIYKERRALEGGKES